MKISIFFRFLIPACIFITSCQKNYDGSFVNNRQSSDTSASKAKLIRIRQGTDAAADTVHLITYDSLNRIKTITDSAYHDTLSAHYDVAGRLSHFTQHDGSTPKTTIASFTYNTTGLLTQVDYEFFGKARFVFEYNNGVVAKKNYYTYNGPGGSLELFRYYTYQFTGGNITTMQTYDPSNTLQEEHKFTYSSQLNPLKDFSLFNFFNMIGLYELANFETFFSRNVLTGQTSGLEKKVFTNTFNNLQQPVKITCGQYDPAFNYLLTWSFFYK